MSFRQEILNDLEAEIKSLGVFKDTFKGVIPAWNYIRNTPAIAIAIQEEERRRVQTSGCQFDSALTIIIMLYNEGSTRKFDDILSEYIELLENTINKSEILNSKTLDIYIEKVTNDTGLIHPKAIAELELKVFYRQNII